MLLPRHEADMTEERGKGERRRKRRPEARPEPTGPRWLQESGTKLCRKCGGRMYPADWIWQKYGLCVGWRCSKCKEKVMARSLPFKGLRKRTLDPDEAAPPGGPTAAPSPDEPSEEAAERPKPARRPRRNPGSRG
jgi:hypothetical protein